MDERIHRTGGEALGLQIQPGTTALPLPQAPNFFSSGQQNKPPPCSELDEEEVLLSCGLIRRFLPRKI